MSDVSGTGNGGRPAAIAAPPLTAYGRPMPLACQLASCDGDQAFIAGLIHAEISRLAKAAPVTITSVTYEGRGGTLYVNVYYLTDAMRPVAVAKVIDVWRMPSGVGRATRWVREQAQALIDAVATGRRAFASDQG